MTEQPATCPDCQHEPHSAGNGECEERIQHGPSRMHLCLCLARPGANRVCPPLMDCQGGPYGYTDIWYLQQGGNLRGADGRIITPDVLIDDPKGAPRASYSRWRVETLDPIADEWAPGSALPSLEAARQRLAQAQQIAPKWRDDKTPVQRRIVRETVTYAVEADQ